MIIELFFKLIFGLVDLFLSLIPAIDFNFEMPDTTAFSEFLGLADYFFPIGTMVTAIAVLLAVQNIQFILKIFNFIIKKIPFIGG
ncbi:hypothetical protein [Enterococcus sp. BWR-S5]|uniref:hypothetical protein n=1 Tax=Enterococcus sp. BWR-S5 TaxID=2787714 RepID=UPI001924E3ED|nr:hypothetical protein [Enterococcus sp. BWR-S5]MBL1224581.1 hypothetical protein [Enterococcus sp. BWR-S5]MBL1224592.1 hypothetical protein [Enterococcus sp. BWR-S5]